MLMNTLICAMLLNTLICAMLMNTLICAMLLNTLICAMLLNKLICAILLIKLICAMLLNTLICAMLLSTLICGMLLNTLICAMLFAAVLKTPPKFVILTRVKPCCARVLVALSNRRERRVVLLLRCAQALNFSVTNKLGNDSSKLRVSAELLFFVVVATLVPCMY